MPKKYLEIVEQLSAEELLVQQPQMVRIEVQDEQEARKKAILYVGAFKGLNCKKFFHIHRLNEEEGCVVNEL